MVNFMLHELHFNERERERKKYSWSWEYSGKARQVSQMTLGPADLKGSTGSDIKVNEQIKASEPVFLLPVRFADTTFQHSLFPTFLL